MDWAFPYGAQGIDLRRKSTNETSYDLAVIEWFLDMKNKESSAEDAIQEIPVFT